MPSASDLSRYHSDTDNFVRQLDEILGASQAAGKNRPQLDAQTAQNRLSALAEQIKGAAVTNADSEEIKILNELTQGLTDRRNFAKNLGRIRKQYGDFQKRRDELFRESYAARNDIEEKLAKEKTDIERARKTLDETERKAKEAMGEAAKDEGKFKGFNELSSDFKQSIQARTEKIKNLQDKLEKKGISLTEIKEIQKEITQALDKAKREADDFKAKSKEVIKLAARTPTTAEEVTGEGEGAEDEQEAKTENPPQATEEASETKPAATAPAPMANAREQEVLGKIAGTPEELAEIDAGWDKIAAETQAQPKIQPSRVIPVGEAAAATAAVTGGLAAGAPGAAATVPQIAQIEVQTAPAAKAQATVSVKAETKATEAAPPAEITVQAAPPAAPAATTIRIEGKLERAAAARGIPASTEAIAAVPGVAIAAVATAFQTQVTALRGQTTLLRQALAGNRPDLKPAELAAQITATQQDIERLQGELASLGQQTDAAPAKALASSMVQVKSAASAVASDLRENRLPTSARLDNLDKVSDQGLINSLGAGAAATAAAAAAAAASQAGPKAAPGGAGQELERARQLMEQRAAEAATLAEGEPPPMAAQPTGASPLAYRGPAPRPTPRMAPGMKIKPPTALPASAPAAAEAAGGPSEGPGGDTEITDQSLGLGGEEQRRSVLEMGAPLAKGAYAQGETPAGPYAGGDELEAGRLMGGGEMVTEEDLARQARLSQQRQLETMQAAVPGQEAPGLAGTAALTGAVGVGGAEELPMPGLGGLEEPEAETGEGAAPGRGGGPMDQAKKLIQDKLREQTDKIKEEIQKKIKEQVKKAFQKMTQKAATKATSAGARTTLEGAEAVNTPDSIGITLAIMIVEMNIQLILKYLLKGLEEVGLDMESMSEELAGEGGGQAGGVMKSFLQQTLVEDFITIFLDCGLICTSNPVCYCIFIILLIILAVMIGLDPDVQSTLGISLG